MPNKLRVKVEAIYRDEQESTAAPAGENLRLRISGTSRLMQQQQQQQQRVQPAAGLLAGCSCCNNCFEPRLFLHEMHAMVSEKRF